MIPPRIRFFFDFVDPLSYLVERELSVVEETSTARIQRVGFELRPPPARLTHPGDPLWSDRWVEARRITAEVGGSLDPPPLVPWSRKAHELHLFAQERGRGEAVRASIFAAYFSDGRDIGRVDELVEIAAAAGLDRTGTKAVLDVDRLEADVVATRREAMEVGVDDVPLIVVGDELVEGFRNHRDLGTLLGGPPGGR